MIDALIIKSMCNKNVFERLHNTIPREALSQDTVNLLSWVSLYYQTYPDSLQVNWETFNSMVALRGTALSPEDKVLMRALIKEVQNAPEADVIAQTKLLAELAYAGEAAALISAYQDGEEVDILYETKNLQRKYGALVSANNELLTWEDRDVDAVLDANEDTNGLKIRCLGLQDSIKGLRGGDTIAVAAPVDSGKTSLLAKLAVDFAEQMKDDTEKYGDRPILWLVNESVAVRSVPRVYQAATNKTLSEIREAHLRQEFLPEYLDKVGCMERIRLKDAHSVTAAQIETLIEEFKPAVLFVDMVANIKGGVYETEHQNLEAKWQFLRELGCEHDVIIIGTMQFSSEGYNIMYPPLTALKQSKVGVQGALDLALFIGRLDPQENPNARDIRGVSTPKNKLAVSGSNGLNQFQIQFDATRCNFILGDV